MLPAKSADARPNTVTGAMPWLMPQISVQSLGQDLGARTHAPHLLVLLNTAYHTVLLQYLALDISHAVQNASHVMCPTSSCVAYLSHTIYVMCMCHEILHARYASQAIATRSA